MRCCSDIVRIYISRDICPHYILLRFSAQLYHLSIRFRLFQIGAALYAGKLFRIFRTGVQLYLGKHHNLLNRDSFLAALLLIGMSRDFYKCIIFISNLYLSVGRQVCLSVGRSVCHYFNFHFLCSYRNICFFMRQRDFMVWSL